MRPLACMSTAHDCALVRALTVSGNVGSRAIARKKFTVSSASPERLDGVPAIEHCAPPEDGAEVRALSRDQSAHTRAASGESVGSGVAGVCDCDGGSITAPPHATSPREAHSTSPIASARGALWKARESIDPVAQRSPSPRDHPSASFLHAHGIRGTRPRARSPTRMFFNQAASASNSRKSASSSRRPRRLCVISVASFTSAFSICASCEADCSRRP